MNQDKYIHGMDWGKEDFSLSDLTNYRKYQYNLISKYIGKNILEIGSGDRGFTKLLTNASLNLERIISIEPSETFYTLYENKYSFPEYVRFNCIDLFDLKIEDYGLFDTIIFIHVLEHIQNDRDALNKAYELLSPHGCILVEVPALSFLFSPHDEMLGHYRRYNKKSMKAIIDKTKFEIVDIWYQDIIGVLGSLYYFKIKKIKLKSQKGTDLITNQGKVYDKFIIPMQGHIENYIRFPFGLNLTVILKKVG